MYWFIYGTDVSDSLLGQPAAGPRRGRPEPAVFTLFNRLGRHPCRGTTRPARSGEFRNSPLLLDPGNHLLVLRLCTPDHQGEDLPAPRIRIRIREAEAVGIVVVRLGPWGPAVV
ncbi:MAG: hypothetical protein LC118_19885 [Dehalococcoidia bacterium]|nr:hypothetical protein [Dehalococcoidia bacterium]